MRQRFPLGQLVDSAVAPEEVLVLGYDTEPAVDTLRCSICGVPATDAQSLPANYANPVCDACDRLAVNEAGSEPWHGWPPGEEPDRNTDAIHLAPDAGENPVYILGVKCWRRYRFGGWITRRDAFDCDTLEEFRDKHRIDGTWIHAFNTPQPAGIDITRDECTVLIDLRHRIERLYEDARQALTEEGDTGRAEELLSRAEACDLSLPDSTPDPASTPDDVAHIVSVTAEEWLHESPLSGFCERYYDT